MEAIMMDRGHGRRWIGMFAILIISIFLKGCYLLLLHLSNKESVIVIPVHASGKQGQIAIVCFTPPKKVFFF